MAINPIQSNTDIKPAVTYRDAKKPLATGSLVHPHAAEGHLVHDTLLTIPKFWLKDIAYDMKAVRDGFNGTAKDHQTGRLNDVGLKLGGIGIATYLASQTTNPKMRIMEYLGLGAFLASMQLYPLIAINAPSRIVHGFDIGKEYIDDQGRKKSVFQDGNYIPYDMYRGEFPGEDIDIIGDRMGIPRDIKNRHELIKEQMRKIAVQNNTLWMLGAGFATPVMTALICCGLEQLLSPAMELAGNKIYNSRISSILKKTKNMELYPEDIANNKLERKIQKFINQFKNKEIAKDELDNIVEILSKETDENLKDGIREDLERLFRSEKNAFVLDDNFTEKISNIIKESRSGRNNATFNDVFTLSKEEITAALANSGSDFKYITADSLTKFKGELKKIFGAKIDASPKNREWLHAQEHDIIENISKSIQKNPSYFVSEQNMKSLTDFAKVMGDFKENDRIIDKCKLFKVEHAPETVLARSYKKFENAIFDSLNISYKDLKKMKESETFTKEILEKKIQELVSNEERYSKTIKKLADIMSETEITLHGNSDKESFIKDLISAIENNYNNTAKRINNIGDGLFTKTVNKLIKEDVEHELKNTIKDKKELFKLIDGYQKPFVPEGEGDGIIKPQIAEELSKGIGSSKGMKISRIIERIQGVENSQRRLLHTLDYFKREVPKDDYGKKINQTVRDALLESTSADFTLKLHTDNNPIFYRDLMDNGWGSSIQDSTKKAMENTDKIENGNILGRFEKYLQRFHDVIGNNDIDFKKPEHRVNTLNKKGYHIGSVTREQKFDLTAQNPIDFFKKASKTRFENKKWLRTASAIGGSVLAATVLIQFCFGKIKNPQNVQKQVSDDKNN